MEVHVDLIAANGAGMGEVATRMLSGSEGRVDPCRMRPWIDPRTGRSYITVYNGGNPRDRNSYRAVPITGNATLRRDEWKQLDDAVMMVSEQRLVGVQDLRSRGLVMTLGNGMGTTVLEWHDVSDALSATISMDGVTRGDADRPKYQHNYIPLPIVHVDYELNERALAVSRRMGNPLDTTLAERAGRKVAEKLEEMLFTNTTYSYGEADDRNRNTIYSYINHPDRNQVTLSTYGNWDDSGTTPTEIINSVRAMKQASINAYHYGPWVLYVPTAYETVLDDDYDTSGQSTQTIRERILKIEGITDVKVIDKLPANNVVLVEMTTDVVRWINGLNIQNVEWSTEGNMVHKYKVMTIQVPQIRSDQPGNSGVVHMS